MFGTTQLDMVAEAAEAPLDVVREVLWHLGDQNLGQQPGSFITALLAAADRADAGNRLKLSLVYAPYMAALRAAREVSIDVLRDRVMAALSAEFVVKNRISGRIIFGPSGKESAEQAAAQMRFEYQSDAYVVEEFVGGGSR